MHALALIQLTSLPLHHVLAHDTQVAQISQTATWGTVCADAPFGLHFQVLKLSPSDLKHPYFLSATSFFVEIEFEDLGASS